MQENCRVCKNRFFKDPIINFSGMPKTTQFFSDNKTLPQIKKLNYMFINTQSVV